jgi:hypothetical protein
MIIIIAMGHGFHGFLTNNQRVFSSNFFVLKFRGDSALDDPMILDPLESCHETFVMGMMPPC